jgi:hypothetical protein
VNTDFLSGDAWKRAAEFVPLGLNAAGVILQIYSVDRLSATRKLATNGLVGNCKTPFLVRPRIAFWATPVCQLCAGFRPALRPTGADCRTLRKP